jgi:hypothetical protein
MSWTNLLVFALGEQVGAQIYANSSTYQTFSQTTWPKRPTLWVSTSTFRPTLVFYTWYLYVLTQDRDSIVCSRDLSTYGQSGVGKMYTLSGWFWLGAHMMNRKLFFTCRLPRVVNTHARCSCVFCSIPTMKRLVRLGCKQHPKQPLGCKYYQPKQPKESLIWFACFAPMTPIVYLAMLTISATRRVGGFEYQLDEDEEEED